MASLTGRRLKLSVRIADVIGIIVVTSDYAACSLNSADDATVIPATTANLMGGISAWKASYYPGQAFGSSAYGQLAQQLWMTGAGRLRRGAAKKADSFLPTQSGRTGSRLRFPKAALYRSSGLQGLPACSRQSEKHPPQLKVRTVTM
jgi:hypothetical protein